MGNGKLKLANKNFSSIPNEYEISFDGQSIVEYVGALSWNAMCTR